MTIKSRTSLRGERNPNAALTKDDVLTIRRRYAAGDTQGALCKVYGVSITTIARIVNYQTWGWVREDGAESPYQDREELPPLTPEQEQAALEAAERIKALGTSDS